jgi:hypothetical protein
MTQEGLMLSIDEIFEKGYQLEQVQAIAPLTLAACP